MSNLPDRWAEIVRRFRLGKVLPRDLEAMRQSAREGVCPFCNAGPFRAVVVHVSRVHDLDRRTFRDQLGVVLGERFTDDDYHARRSAMARANLSEAFVNADRTKRHTLSAAGREAQRVKALRNLEVNPDHMARIGRLVSRESHSRAGMLGVAARLEKYDRASWSAMMREANASRAKIPRERYAEVRRRVAEGESTDAVAASYGASRALVNSIISGRKDLPYLGRDPSRSRSTEPQ